jgi:hypothetical protein
VAKPNAIAARFAVIAHEMMGWSTFFASAGNLHPIPKTCLQDELV